MWSVWRRCQQGSWTLAVRALQRRRGMRRRTRAGRSAGMLAGEVLTPNISARRQAQQSTLRRPRDGLGMRGGSSRPLRMQPKCTSRRGHRHRRGASCRCAGAARAAKRPAVRSTRRPRPASCTRTLWGTSGWTRRSPQSCETGTGGAGRARGRGRHCSSSGKGPRGTVGKGRYIWHTARRLVLPYTHSQHKEEQGWWWVARTSQAPQPMRGLPGRHNGLRST